MRYADGPTVDVEVFVDASPARVWDVVTDITVPARFSTELQGAEWISGDGPALGATFRGHNEHEAVGQWETTSVVVSFDAERVFAWAVGDVDAPSATWRFELTAEGSGTRLKQSAHLGPGASGLTAAIERMPDKEERIIERRLQGHRENMLRTVEGIKAIAEAD